MASSATQASLDFDEVVRSNIQDVLDAVARTSISSHAADAATTAADTTRQETLPPSRSTSRDAGGWLDPAMLEVPHNSDATIRLLKARIKSLEEQLGTALKLNQEKESVAVDLQKQVRQLTQNEAAFSKQQKALEAQVERHRHAAAAAREAAVAKEQQLKELSKDGARADKDRRQLEQESHARDVQLQRALEEVEKYKQLLQDVQLQGQEVKDVARSKHTQALADVKRLERQKGELLTVLKKQARLIDVLRRQRAHLEAAQLLSFSEEEFMQTLDVRAG